jgi:hypothetical protein
MSANAPVAAMAEASRMPSGRALTTLRKRPTDGVRTAAGSVALVREGRMGGYVVTTDNGNGHRNFFMVNNADPKSACAEINRFMTLDNAVALAPMSDVTLDHFQVAAGRPWLFTTIHSPTGKVTKSQLK